jgi:hypothetical protein
VAGHTSAFVAKESTRVGDRCDRVVADAIAAISDVDR